MSKKCWCGFDMTSSEPHPCHRYKQGPDGVPVQCGAPAKERFYNCRPAALAGVQMKLVCDSTWGCDACWEATRGERDQTISEETPKPE